MPDSAIRTSSDEDWDALMRQLRAQPKAQPRPFFYGRVRARLATEAAASHWPPVWLRRPTYAAMLGALVLSLSGDCSVLRPVASPASSAAHPGYQPLRGLPR